MNNSDKEEWSRRVTDIAMKVINGRIRNEEQMIDEIMRNLTPNDRAICTSMLIKKQLNSTLNHLDRKRDDVAFM